MWILSADIGGTKLALSLSRVDAPARLVRQMEIISPQQSDALFEAIINGWNELLQNEQGEVSKVAVGLPGILNIKKGIVIHQQNLPWREFPLVEKLQNVYPNAQIRMETDMMTAANGEYKIRDFKQETLIYLTISTGIACCSIHQGEFIRGAGIPGEVGFSITSTGAFFEEECAGPAIEKKLQQKTNAHQTLQQLFERYYNNDEEVVLIIKQWQQEIAQKIHAFILLMDPHVVVLGGGVMNHHPQMVEEIGQLVDSYFSLPFFYHKKGRVQASMNKGNAGLIGAALL